MPLQKQGPLVIAIFIGFILLFSSMLFFMPYFLRVLPIPWEMAGFQCITSEGDRTGQVVRLSRSGFMWKTDEGTLVMTQGGASYGYWNFSIDPQSPGAKDTLRALEEARDNGAIVKVHYRQHAEPLPWRGQTSTLIDYVTVLQQGRK